MDPQRFRPDLSDWLTLIFAIGMLWPLFLWQAIKEEEPWWPTGFFGLLGAALWLLGYLFASSGETCFVRWGCI